MSRAPTSIARETKDYTYPDQTVPFRERNPRTIDPPVIEAEPEVTFEAEPEPEPVVIHAAGPPPPVAVETNTDWQTADTTPPSRLTVLVTHDPEAHPEGRYAMWYPRRQFHLGRWQLSASWVDPLNMKTIHPQPSHWRHDPARTMLRVDAR
jgi:hypothetical protein